MLLESYTSIDNTNINIKLLLKNNKEEITEKIGEYIENNSSPMKYSFEIIPFKRNGIITSYELIYSSNFYIYIPKKNLGKEKKDILHIIKYKCFYIIIVI